YQILHIFLKMCDSTCFHEENSTTPMRAIRITTSMNSWLLCVKECYKEAQCLTASYSDKLRVCHLQTGLSSDSPQCDVVPYR
ncbi:hypothetical protein PMAYCL1PPCAC_21446, partial [Pristionchus mayeri]